jgi:hypothetical protein
VNGAVLQSWGAWSPGLESRAAWQAWARSPVALEREGRPEAGFLPALLRRRCSTLTRVMLTAAYECCPPAERSQVRTVFASRHGNINDSIEMVERLAVDLPLSPARFSHTVHNAQAGLFSIAAENREASSSVAAQEDSFACAWIEALTHLQRDPSRSVLLVMADIPLAATFAALVEEPVATYGVALLLAARGSGQHLAFRAASVERERPVAAWPDAVEFLRWLLGDQPRLALGAGARRWQWERGAVGG